MQFKKQRILYVAVVAGMLLIFFWEREKLTVVLDAVERESQTAITNPQSQISAPIPSEPAKPSGNSPKNIEQFTAWLKTESTFLDRNSADAFQREPILKEQAALFTSENIRFLRATATDSSVTANERILSAYLLTIGTDNSVLALQEIAQTPYSLPNPQPAHSIGETTLMQEKSIRVMAIDELFNRFETGFLTQQQLNNFIQKIPDAALKQYALKRLSELQ